MGGDAVAELARRDYGGDPVSDDEWARVFAAFGPEVPGPYELARRVGNRELGRHGMELLRRFDVVDQLVKVDCPTLVCVGELDPITPPEAARELYEALPEAVARLAVIKDAGHFPWKDAPERYWTLLADFVTTAWARDRPEIRT